MRVEVYHSPSEGWFCFVEDAVRKSKKGPIPKPKTTWIGGDYMPGYRSDPKFIRERVKACVADFVQNKTATVPKKRATKR